MIIEDIRSCLNKENQDFEEKIEIYQSLNDMSELNNFCHHRRDFIYKTLESYILRNGNQSDLLLLKKYFEDKSINIKELGDELKTLKLDTNNISYKKRRN